MQTTTFEIRSRVDLENLEEKTLAPYAQKSRDAYHTRLHEEPQHPYRTAFQRDRDRIIHSRAFRRLKHKRQVFLISESDHYRTRITHTLEVSQLSRTMARALGLNEDLVEAIALGHDLGHTPFGHLGEKTLHAIMSGAMPLRGLKNNSNFGGFKHNYQSLRVVDYLERKYTFKGLNLTAPVREGILKHTRLLRGTYDYPDFRYDGLHFELDHATTLEGQVVAICDEIAQRTHDLEDGIRAGLVELKKVKTLKIVKDTEKKLHIDYLYTQDEYVYLGLLIRALINVLVDDVIQQTLKNLQSFQKRKGRLHNFDEEIVTFSPDIDPLQKELNKFIYQEIIRFSRINWADDLAEKLLFRLFEAYFNEPTLLPDYVLERYFQEKNQTFTKQIFNSENILMTLQNDTRFLRTICDYIAGMTDNFALYEAERLARLKKIEASDLHLEVATAKYTKFAGTEASIPTKENMA